LLNKFNALPKGVSRDDHSGCWPNGALDFNQSIWYFKYLIEQFNETCWTARSGVANWVAAEFSDFYFNRTTPSRHVATR
jgi:hypothetical protein